MRQALRAVLAAAIAGLALATPAFAEPTIGVSETCVFSGGQLVVFGNGFEPNQRTTAEVMPTPDPLSGTALTTAEVIADAGGNVNGTLDVPWTAGARHAGRSVRMRPDPDPATATPTVLAAAGVKTALRSAVVEPVSGPSRAGRVDRWRLTGLPVGTRLYAHYRHAGRTIARRSLGIAQEPCGELDFDLRTLPQGRERRGTWDLWITSSRRFAIPRKRVYVHRRMTVAGSGAAARVTAAAPDSRLVSIDPRAPGPVTNAFAADATRIGVIRLIFNRALGAPVEFYERIGDRIERLGVRTADAGASTVLDDATTWSCRRLVRRFFATAILPDGTKATGAHTIRTPSCVDRFRLTVPRRVAPGAHVDVRVADRWGIGGVSPQLCVTPPQAPRRCAMLPFEAAVTHAARGLRARRRGLWTVELRIRGHRLRETFGVGAGVAPGPSVPRVLATGDSMMQGIDSFLADELGDEAKVRSDIHVGAGISLHDGEWEGIATSQVASVKPRATVISIGAAEGFAMTTPDGAKVPCCDEPWLVEYTRRVRAMMTTYARGGRGRVFWLTVPAPRLTARQAATKAVNAAILRAADGQPRVTVLRMDQLFSPNGYQDSIRYRGRLVRAREIDGIHLSVAGTAIAAQVVAAAIRKG